MSYRIVNTRYKVEQLWRAGLSGNEIARQLGIAKSTVAYHLRRLGKPVDEKCNRRYDWSVIQEYYDEGRSITECQLKFGFSRETWNAARLRGDVTSRPQAMPLEELLSKPRNRDHLRRRLTKLGLLPDHCQICGLKEWRGKALGLELHHVNGDPDDNRLENLQILCPNCHCQTDSWGGRNKGKVIAIRHNPEGT